VIKALRDWMKQYWEEDFAYDEEVRKEMIDWITEMEKISVEFSWSVKFAETIKSEFKRYLDKGSRSREKSKDYSAVKLPIKYSLEKLEPEELSDQITLIDFNIFRKIEARECLEQAWKKKR